MRGRFVGLSVARRIVVETMRVTRDVPNVAIVRRMNLGALVAARGTDADAAPWSAILVKAFALVADEQPALRRGYMKFPWAHFYEYPTSIAGVAIEREFEGEPCVFFGIVEKPHGLALTEIGRKIRVYARAPLTEIGEFQKIIGIARLPAMLRRAIWWLGFQIAAQRVKYFGTFVVTGISALGADMTYLTAAGTFILYWGPIAANGDVDVHLVFDHRVIDGLPAARALDRLEEILNGAILKELAGRPARQPLRSVPP